MLAAFVKCFFATVGIYVTTLELFELVGETIARFLLLLFHAVWICGVLPIRFCFPFLCVPGTFGFGKRVARFRVTQQHSLFIRRAIASGQPVPERDDLSTVELVAREVFFSAF